jgi:hypothetical protein
MKRPALLERFTTARQLRMEELNDILDEIWSKNCGH